MENILTVDNMYFTYGEKLIFDDISFKIKRNTITSILGSNNCGKTTLIKVLSGILLSNGFIHINDLPLRPGNSKIILLNIGVVLSLIDKQFLFDDVMSEMAFPLENLKYSRKNIKEAIRTISSLLGIESIVDGRIKDLNGYQKLLVLIAVSIIHNPRVLFLDDVFINLSKSEIDALFKILKKLINERDLTIVFTTSNVIDILPTDRVLVINEGKIMMDDKPMAILEHENELSKIGVNIPTMVDLSMKLKFYNLVDKIYLDTDKVVNKLWP